MPRKEAIFFKLQRTSIIFLMALGVVLFIPSESFAQTKSASCDAKPLMQQQVIASYAQSSYRDCLTDKSLCKDMYSQEPQVAKVDIKADKELKTAQAPAKKASPSASPTPSPSIIPSPTPTPASKVDNSSGLSADKLFEMINAHRDSKGLPAYEKDAKLCELAASRGPELHEEIYGSKYIHQGFKERNLPFWITENMISKESEEIAMKWWLNSSLHRAGIESSKKYACGVCSGNSCAMLFTSWEAK